jgi:hypothetical protein
MTERDRAARRRLVWLLLSRGDVGAESLHSDGLPALRRGPARVSQNEGRAAGRDDRAAAHPLRRPRS